MSKDHPLLADILYNQALMVQPHYLATALKAFEVERQNPLLITGELPENVSELVAHTDYMGVMSERAYDSRRDREERVISNDGIALIDVRGSLAQRQMAGLSTSTRGYNGIVSDVEAAVGDDRVRGIMLNIDSPGGVVSANFATAKKIKELSAQKPIASLVNERAFSAAFSIASATYPIYMPDTAEVGSVGVLRAHMNHEQMLKDKGVEVTFIYAGDHKIDGNPTQALPEGVKADWQQDINRYYGMFTGLVANNRSMQQSDVVATQARTYGAEEAIKIGFADVQVASAEDAMEHFTSFLSGASPTNQASNMSTKVSATSGASQVGDQMFTQADLTQATADGHATGLAQAEANVDPKRTYEAGEAAGVAAERERFTAIVTSEHSAGPVRAPVALSFAKDGMAADAAIAALQHVPNASALAVVEALAGDAGLADVHGDNVGEGAGAQVSQSLEQGTGALITTDEHAATGASIASEYNSVAFTGQKPQGEVYVG